MIMIISGNSRTFADFKHQTTLKETTTTQGHFKVVLGFVEEDTKHPDVGDKIEGLYVVRVDLAFEADEVACYRVVLTDSSEARIPSDILIPASKNRGLVSSLNSISRKFEKELWISPIEHYFNPKWLPEKYHFKYYTFAVSHKGNQIKHKVTYRGALKYMYKLENGKLWF